MGRFGSCSGETPLPMMPAMDGPGPLPVIALLLLGGVAAGLPTTVAVWRRRQTARTDQTDYRAQSVLDVGHLLGEWPRPAGSVTTLRSLLPVALVIGLLVQLTPQAALGDTQGLPAAPPEEHGLDSTRLAEVLTAMPDASPGIHSLVLVRNGSLLADASFYPYDGATPHGLESVTKAITSALAGIAADQGLLGLDDSVLSFFPDREIANVDERKERLTVADLANMTTGLDCSDRSLDEMRASEDWVRFVLDLPMNHEPGTAWGYCNPATHLLSAVITEATGMSTLGFATRNLFDPLDIAEVIWPSDPQGYSHGWASLMMYPSDVAKLGQLWLNGGEWDGQQVLSTAFVEASSTPAASAPGGLGYSYGWLIEQTEGVGPVISARGGGGQYVVMIPAIGVVVGATGAGTYGPGDLVGSLATTLVDPASPLPSDPDGEAALADAIERLGQAPSAGDDQRLPNIASEISGISYRFEANPLGLDGMKLEFDETLEASLTLALAGAPTPVTLPVGLDGLYRFAPGEFELPVGLRGAWVDEQTFVLDYDTIANVTAMTLRMRWDEETVAVEATDRTNGDIVQFEGFAA